MSDQSDRIGVGVIGLGWVAGSHVRAYQQDARTRVVAVAGREVAKTRARAEELGLGAARVHDDWTALLRDPEVRIVSICTPHWQHAEQAIAAAEAGKHVLIEKPIALTLDELRALRDAVRSAGVRAMCSFVLRWNPLLQGIDRRVREGELGRLSLARFDYWNRQRRGLDTPGWWHTTAQAGSTLLHGGCHAADAMRWLVGSEVVEVQALGTSRHAPFEYPPTIAALVAFADGTVGQLSATIEGALPYAFNVELIGERGSVRDARVYLHEGDDRFREEEVPGTRPDSREVSHHPFPQEIAALVDAVIEEREPEAAGLEDAVRTHELCIACDMAAAERRPVRLPLLT
jgi:predicted dehydrogenase